MLDALIDKSLDYLGLLGLLFLASFPKFNIDDLYLFHLHSFLPQEVIALTS